MDFICNKISSLSKKLLLSLLIRNSISPQLSFIQELAVKTVLKRDDVSILFSFLFDTREPTIKLIHCEKEQPGNRSIRREKKPPPPPELRLLEATKSRPLITPMNRKLFSCMSASFSRPTPSCNFQ
jgi:hypothetical protein